MQERWSFKYYHTTNIFFYRFDSHSEYRKLNPTQSKRDFRDVEEDLRLLIKQKEKLYPEVQIQIVDAHLQEINGKNHVTVVSLNIK